MVMVVGEGHLNDWGVVSHFAQLLTVCLSLSTSKAKKVKGVLTVLLVALGRLLKGTYRIVAHKTSRERVLVSTGRDPLRCTRCGGEMMLWQVWHPHDGVVYNELHEIKRGRYGPRRGVPPDARVNGERAQPMRQLTLTGLRV
jgi:hypothetical protein